MHALMNVVGPVLLLAVIEEDTGIGSDPK